MYQEHYQFHTPDKSLTIWRYIDFTKFVDLVLNQELFFCRSDRFEDPFEGIFRLKDYEQTKNMFELFAETKKYYFLNCWHINEHQSDAMWKIFLDTNNGIAIKSSINSLINSFSAAEETVHIGEIFYRDYNEVTFDQLMQEPQNKVKGRPGGRSLNQFNYKRKSFEHEKELRVFFLDMPIPHAIIDGIEREPINFKKIKVNLNELIIEVVVAPFADAWFKDLVENFVSKLNCNFKISKSNLYELND